MGHVPSPRGSWKFDLLTIGGETKDSLLGDVGRTLLSRLSNKLAVHAAILTLLQLKIAKIVVAIKVRSPHDCLWDVDVCFTQRSGFNQLSATDVSRLDFRQLRHAVFAADYGSMRQAAEALLIKQSTLSRSIRQLEHTLGVAVFERTTAGVRETVAGRHFLRMARSVLEQMDTIVAATKAKRRGESGHIVVGFCTSLTTGNLRATLIEFRRRFPGVGLGTVERSREGLVTALRNGAIDVHIMTGDTPLFDNKTIPLWGERVFVVLPNDHSLATQEVVYWTDLRSQTVLLSQYDPGRELEDLLIAKLTSTGERPRIERRDVSRGVIKNLVCIGLGLGLVLESDVGTNISGLTYRELRDGSGPSRIGFSATWREDNENPSLADFLRLLAERYPSPT